MGREFYEIKPEKTIHIPGIRKKIDIFCNRDGLYYTNLIYKWKNYGVSMDIDLSKRAKTIPELLEKIKGQLSIERNRMDRKNSNLVWTGLVYLRDEIKQYKPQLNYEVIN